MTDYDVIIIGTGAGGSTVARSLADTGKKILMLERGDFLPREPKNWDPEHIFLNRGYQIEEEWMDEEAGAPFLPQAYYRVGGNTKVYGSVLMRMRAEDFGEQRWPDGVSPAWPLDYSEYERYYTLAEDWYCIHGKLGEDPTEPEHSGGDFPFEHMPHEPRIQAAADELAAQGLHPIHSTLSLNRDVSKPDMRPCIRCRTCDPYPCMLHAKQDAETAGVRPALLHDNVELWTGAYVDRIEARGTKVDTVHVEVEGKRYELRADTVFVCCGSVNSAALLLRSGIHDASGLLGRNLMKHNHSGLLAVGERENPTVFQKTLGFHDYYHRGPEPHQTYGLGAVQLTGKAPWQRIKLFSGMDDAPDEHFKYLERHGIDWWLTTDDLPEPTNRVKLQADGRPSLDFRPNNRKPHEELIETWISHLRRTGDYQFMVRTMGIETLWHQAGTALYGEDEATSVLDLGCRAHAYDNLHVVDSSFMPGMGAVNLTLTIIANAIRVCDGLRQNWGYAPLADERTRPGQAVPGAGTVAGLEGLVKQRAEMV